MESPPPPRGRVRRFPAGSRRRRQSVAPRRSAPADSFLRRTRARRSCAHELADHDGLSERSGDDGAHPDPQIENAPKLVLLDALLGEPSEDGRACPCLPVDPRREAVGHDARQVAEDPAAGHVRERSHVCAGAELTDLVDVEPVWREEQVGIEVTVADERPDEREAVRVQAARGKAYHEVAGLAARAVDEAVALNDADTRAGEIQLGLLVDAGQLRGLAADEDAPGRTAD